MSAPYPATDFAIDVIIAGLGWIIVTLLFLTGVMLVLYIYIINPLLKEFGASPSSHGRHHKEHQKQQQKRQE